MRVESAQLVAIQAHRAGVKRLVHISGIGADAARFSAHLGVGGEGGRSFKVAQSATAARLRRRPFGDSTARSALAVLASGRARAQQQRRPSGF